MPSKYTLETLPVPLDSKVKLRNVAAHTVAAVRYTAGVSDTAKMDQHTALVRSELEAAGLPSTGDMTLCEYAPPFQLAFLRPVEVMVALPDGTA